MADFATANRPNSNTGFTQGGSSGGITASLSDHLAGNGGYTSRSRCEKTSLSRYLESRGAAVTSIGSTSKESMAKCGEPEHLDVSFKFYPSIKVS